MGLMSQLSLQRHHERICVNEHHGHDRHKERYVSECTCISRSAPGYARGNEREERHLSMRLAPLLGQLRDDERNRNRRAAMAVSLSTVKESRTKLFERPDAPSPACPQNIWVVCFLVGTGNPAKGGVRMM